jgi:hypothetical protein
MAQPWTSEQLCKHTHFTTRENLQKIAGDVVWSHEGTPAEDNFTLLSHAGKLTVLPNQLIWRHKDSSTQFHTIMHTFPLCSTSRSRVPTILLNTTRVPLSLYRWYK